MKEEILQDFKKVSSPKKAEILQKFFKTGKGQYGEGDIFIGVVVPEIRKLVNKYYKTVTMDTIQWFLHNKIHEYRLFALLLLVKRYEQYPTEREEIYAYYISNTKWINNWDLVDLSAPNIVGEYLKSNKRDILLMFSASRNIWEVRVAVLSTFRLIKNGEYTEILQLSKNLLNHPHDLIHKATGWMLRELGKRDISVLRDFLNKYSTQMPRTMLRYSIEKLDSQERNIYMQK